MNTDKAILVYGKSARYIEMEADSEQIAPPVPEPATMLHLVLELVGLAGIRRNKV